MTNRKLFAMAVPNQILLKHCLFQVQYQNYVNDLIKTIVCHHEDVFVNIEGGVVYEKSIIEDW